MKPDVLATYSAARTIIKNARNCDVETGGVLVGTLGEPIVIVAAGDPGENAIHRPTQFTSDPEADKSCLYNARQIYGSGIVLVGYYHKHPFGFNRPSSGDCQQVGQLKKEYNDDRPVLMGIVNEKPGRLKSKVSLHLYSIRQASQLLEHDWKLVKGKNKELLETISKAPVRPEIDNADFWNDRDFQFYLNPIGRQRVLREIEGLRKSGWQTRTSRCKQDNTLIIDTFNDTATLRFILPPEYPLNPPAIFAGDGETLRGLEIPRQWNSLYCLSDLASEVRSVLSCACCKRKAMTQSNQLSTICVKEQQG